MIGSIGWYRFLLLLILVVGVVASWGVNAYWLQPQTRQAQAQLGAVQGEAYQLAEDIRVMREDIDTFEEQKILYNLIRDSGFFGDQDRLVARDRMNFMQKDSKILSVRYEIRPAERVPSDLVSKAGYEILESSSTVNLSAIDDLDIYKFIHYIHYGFPGHMIIRDLTIERKDMVDVDAIRSLGHGTPQELVTAQMNLEWRTLVPAEAPPEDGEGDDPYAYDDGGVQW